MRISQSTDSQAQSLSCSSNYPNVRMYEAVTLPFNYRSAPEIVAAGEAALGESRGYSARNNSKGIIEFHYFENGLKEQASEIIDILIPAALKRDKERKSEILRYSTLIFMMAALSQQ